MLIVAGINLANLKPRVWDASSPYHLPRLDAVMVSYAEFHTHPVRRERAMRDGLHSYLSVPPEIPIYLDNGSFSFERRGIEVEPSVYAEFVDGARPDWWPVARDFIPAPAMSDDDVAECFSNTMRMNLEARERSDVPVVHVSRLIERYVAALLADDRLVEKRTLALGGIVPNLLRAPKALPYQQILDALIHVRQNLDTHRIHLFGVGGTSTLHLTRLLGIDSVDSSGWRNRAARGIVQLPGRGDRSVADLGSWSGRQPSLDEWSTLACCRCPACIQFGLDGLRLRGIEGFSNRATHNLWTLYEESALIERHLVTGSYHDWFSGHIKNSTYLPLIRYLVDHMGRVSGRHELDAGRV